MNLDIILKCTTHHTHHLHIQSDLDQQHTQNTAGRYCAIAKAAAPCPFLQRHHPPAGAQRGVVEGPEGAVAPGEHSTSSMQYDLSRWLGYFFSFTSSRIHVFALTSSWTCLTPLSFTSFQIHVFALTSSCVLISMLDRNID